MCEFKDSIDNIVLLSIIILIFCKHIGGLRRQYIPTVNLSGKKKKPLKKIIKCCNPFKYLITF